MTTATKPKRATKLDRLLEQGEWVALPMDGTSPPCRFVMPTEELQTEVERELEKQIKKHLKAAGFERICATQREHPFHSAILRDRVDALMQDFGETEYRTPEGIEATRRALYDLARRTKHALAPFTRRDADHIIAQGIKENSDRVLWASAYNWSQELLRDWYWRRTEEYLFMTEPPLPEGTARPKPVYVNKEHPAVVLQLQDGAVNYYVQRGHGVVEFA